MQQWVIVSKAGEIEITAAHLSAVLEVAFDRTEAGEVFALLTSKNGKPKFFKRGKKVCFPLSAKSAALEYAMQQAGAKNGETTKD